MRRTGESAVGLDCMLGEELRNRSEDAASPVAEENVASCCSLVPRYALWCSRWTIIQARTAADT